MSKKRYAIQLTLFFFLSTKFLWVDILNNIFTLVEQLDRQTVPNVLSLYFVGLIAKKNIYIQFANNKHGMNICLTYLKYITDSVFVMSYLSIS